MRKELQSRWVALFSGDLFAILLVSYGVFSLLIATGYETVPPRMHQMIAAMATLWMLSLYFGDLYVLDKLRRKAEVALRVLSAAVLTCVLFTLASRVVPGLTPNPDFVIANGLAAGGTLLLWRLVLADSIQPKDVVLIGTPACVHELTATIRRNEHLGYKLAGVVDLGHNPDAPSLRHRPTAEGAMREDGQLRDPAKTLIVFCSASAAHPAPELLKWRFDGARVVDCNAFYEGLTGKLPVDWMQERWLVLAPGFNTSPFILMLKRIFDVVGATVILIATLPISIVTALLIKLDSSGPLIYTQERVGQKGRVFKIYKFRSMQHNVEETTGPCWAGLNDPRATRVGRVIRRYRIDELPQLLNVIKGDMSLVGPRPERPELTLSLAQAIPFYNLRSHAKPGITGWAQVCFPYGASVEEAKEKLCYDLYYLKNWTLMLDCQILFQSLKIVMLGRRAR